MKALLINLIVVLSITQFLFAGEMDKYDKDHWKQFSKNVKVALNSENDGLKQSSMRHIVFYGEKLHTNGMIFDLVEIYEDHADVRMRQMAAVAMHYTGNKWAHDYLKKQVSIEKNTEIKKILIACVNESQNGNTNDQNEKMDPQFADLFK